MKTVLVTSFDDNYMEYSKVFVKTLSENYSGKDIIDLYCLVPENILSYEQEFIDSVGDIGNLRLSFKCSKKFLDLSNKLLLSGKDYITINAWHRIFIPSICSDFERAIYIDSDTIVLRDIDPIINFNEKSVFAAYIQDDPDLSMNLFGTYDRPYFNAGVFIVDLNYWRNSGIEDKMVNDIISSNTTSFLDQDALNVYFADVLTVLPITFNYPHWYHENDLTYIKSPIIVHFIGPNKPWHNYQSKSIFPIRWKQKHYDITGIKLDGMIPND